MEKNNQKKGFFKLCLSEFKFGAIAASAYILICCLVSWIFGYKLTGEVTFILGIPTWAVFGVFIPWITMVVITTIYGFFIMEGDEEE